MTSQHSPVFQIEDNDDDDLADAKSYPVQAQPPPPLHGDAVPHEKQKLLSDASNADRCMGTVGCCGAVCMLLGCLPFGLCWRELRETYANHTLCGRWCPV